MGKDKQKSVEPETKEEAKQETSETVRQETEVFGITVGMSVYKPIPRFRGNCKNC